jgi:hypothetical protein
VIILLPLLFLIVAVASGYVIGWHAGREYEQVETRTCAARAARIRERTR